MSSGDVLLTQSQTFLYEKTWRKMLFNFAGVLSAAFLLIVILAIGLVTSTQGAFLSNPNVENLTQLWTLHAMWVPATVLIIAAGGIDLSIAAVMAATAILVASLAPILSLPVAVFFGLAMALLAGIINGLLVGATRLNGAIVTLGMMVLLRGLVNLAALGKPRRFSIQVFLPLPPSNGLA